MALDWSHSKYTPFAHQYEDTETVIKLPYVFIASEMRTGKTKIVIDAAQFLFHAGVIDRVIVLCPEPVRSVWVGATADALRGELREHLWDITPATVTEFHSDVNQWRVGPPCEKGKDLRIIVTNYEFMRPYRTKNSTEKTDENLKTLLKYCGPKTLLVEDESGCVTNHKSETFDACFKMRVKCGRIIMMNGTPFDTPIHMFAQGRMLSDSILECKFITHFRNRYCTMGGFRVGATRKKDPKTGKITWEGGRPTEVVDWVNLDDLQARFAPYTILRLQKDCLDVPQKLKPVTYTAKLTEKTWKPYKDMRDEMVIMFKNGTTSLAQQAIVKFLRMSQITGGFVGGIENAAIDPPCSSCDGAGCEDCEGSGIGVAQPVSRVLELGREKLDVLLWLVQNKIEKDPNIKFVVWARFMDETLRIVRELQKAHPQMIVAGMHGKNSKAERKYAKALLDPRTVHTTHGPIGVIVTLGTGSYGLDMSAAHTSINYSYDHSLRKALQSQDRVYGPRQTEPIDYFDIVAVGPKGQRTYDSVIVEARQTKQDLATWTQSAWVTALSEPVQECAIT